MIAMKDESKYKETTETEIGAGEKKEKAKVIMMFGFKGTFNSLAIAPVDPWIKNIIKKIPTVDET